MGAQVRVQECGHARWGGIGIPAIRRRRPGPRGRFFTFDNCHDTCHNFLIYTLQNTEGDRHLIDFERGDEQNGRKIAGSKCFFI